MSESCFDSGHVLVAICRGACAVRCSAPVARVCREIKIRGSLFAILDCFRLLWVGFGAGIKSKGWQKQDIARNVLLKTVVSSVF